MLPSHLLQYVFSVRAGSFWPSPSCSCFCAKICCWILLLSGHVFYLCIVNIAKVLNVTTIIIIIRESSVSSLLMCSMQSPASSWLSPSSQSERGCCHHYSRWLLPAPLSTLKTQLPLCKSSVITCFHSNTIVIIWSLASNLSSIAVKSIRPFLSHSPCGKSTAHCRPSERVSSRIQV